MGNSGQANYGAAKSGIAGFTKVVAKDMGRYGVTVNSIAPRASTRMIADIPGSASEIRARSGVAPIAGEEDLANLDPDHIAPFVAYLASDFAENVNGQTFLVYGDTISLVSQPRPERAIYEPSGTWDMDKLSQMARDVLTKDIPNPAPAREPS
jgi:enoyl-[acyl-carrier-protein] reductase (NADH)